MNKHSIKIRLDTADKVKSFIKTTMKYESDIEVYKSDKKSWNGKSILAMFTINLSEDVYVAIKSNNSEEIDMFIQDMIKFEVK